VEVAGTGAAGGQTEVNRLADFNKK
jgi:hypothetical protein